MIDGNGNLFLVDFGLAACRQLDTALLTEMGTVLGTPAFMPPEQARGEIDRVGPWSDQYGAGAVLFKMLTGNVPYPGKGYAVLGDVGNYDKPPQTLRHFRPRLDPALESLVMQSLAKFPGERFQSCASSPTACKPGATGRAACGRRKPKRRPRPNRRRPRPNRPPPGAHRREPAGFSGRRSRSGPPCWPRGALPGLELHDAGQTADAHPVLRPHEETNQPLTFLTLLGVFMNAKSTMRAAWCAALAGCLGVAGPAVVRAEVYGGVEIGAKGVKATVLDVTGAGEDEEAAVKLADTTNTGLASDVAKDGRFGDAALADTAKAVAAYCDRFHKEFGVAAERTYVVGSSGLFAAIDDKPDLIKENQARLSGAVKERTGVDMAFIDVRRESELSIVGIVPQKHRGDGVLIDIGGGNTKGGCEVEAGKFATFGVPFGTATFAELAKKEGAGDAKALAKLCDDKVAPPLKKGISELPGLAKRDNVYLSGGVVWSAATSRTRPTPSPTRP